MILIYSCSYKDFYLYEVIEDFKNEKDESTKQEIVKCFCEQLWLVPNEIEKTTCYIKYKMYNSTDLDKDVRKVFEKYKKIPYIHNRSFIDNLDSWFLLRQKINNMFVFMCDPDICMEREYFEKLKTAKYLYYDTIHGKCGYTASEINDIIKTSLTEAEKIKQQFGIYKMRITWEQYKNVINYFIYKCFKNYKPLEERCDITKTVVEVDYWLDDNYIIRYLGKSLSGYLKNYEKEVYSGVTRMCGSDKREYKRCVRCGRLYIQKSKKQRYCKRCTYYTPIESKIITCEDCGDIFIVKGIVKNKKRCDACQVKANKKNGAKRYKKWYYKNKPNDI